MDTWLLSRLLSRLFTWLSWARATLRSVFESKETPDVFPHAVSAVLSHLKLFPQLDTLSVSFDINEREVWGIVDRRIGQPEFNQDTQEAAITSTSRRLLEETYQAIGKNEDHTIQTLCLNNIPPIRVISARGLEFGRFLSTILDFQYSIQGGYGGESAKAILSCGGYVQFCNELPFFLGGLFLVKHLRLAADESGPLGWSWEFRTSASPLILVKLSSLDFPTLTSIHLEEMFTCKEFCDFLCNHKDVLEVVILQSCSGGLIRLLEGGEDFHPNNTWTWAHLFKCFSGTKRLRQLDIRPWRAPSLGDHGVLTEMQRKELMTPAWQSIIREAEAILENEPERPIFAYTTLDSDNNWSRKSYRPANLYHFLKRSDQKAYEELFSQIEVNKLRRT